jgi:hypothetical protein
MVHQHITLQNQQLEQKDQILLFLYIFHVQQDR